MRGTPAGLVGLRRRRGGGWRWREPELLEQAKLVEAAPAFDDLPVGDAEDVDPAEDDLASGGGLAHDRAAVGAVGDEVFGHEVVLGDQLLDVAAPVGKGAPEDLAGLPHSFRPVWGAGKRRVMVDEARIEIPVDRGQVPCGEQGVDELVDDLLVCIGSGHGYTVNPPARSHHPSKVGVLFRPEGRSMAAWTEGI